MIKCNKYVSLI